MENKAENTNKEAVVEEVKDKCFWEVTNVEENGDIIIRVYNKDKQAELNKMMREAMTKYNNKKQKTKDQDDKFAELANSLGFDDTDADVFSVAGKAYIYNVKREMIKDIKLEGNKQAMQEGKAAAQEHKTRKEAKERTVETVTVDIDSLEDITL